MGKVEENIQKILEDIKNSRFENEISKLELIKIINKYTQSPYGYLNRLWVDNYIKKISEETFQILSLEFHSTNGESD